MENQQRPPRGLKPAGRSLWIRIADGLVLDRREYAILQSACELADEISMLTAVGNADPIVAGSTGQPVVHPALREARQARVTLTRLLGMLSLPAEVDDVEATPVQTARQRNGRAAAVARWARARQRQGEAVVDGEA